MAQISKKINLKPTPGHVLIQRDEAEEKTESGIYLPDAAKGEKPQRGVVLAVGGPEQLDNTTRECPVSVGDKVIYKKWGGNDVKLDGEEYLFVKFEDVLATIN